MSPVIEVIMFDTVDYSGNIYFLWSHMVLRVFNRQPDSSQRCLLFHKGRNQVRQFQRAEHIQQKFNKLTDSG